MGLLNMLPKPSVNDVSDVPRRYSILFSQLGMHFALRGFVPYFNNIRFKNLNGMPSSFDLIKHVVAICAHIKVLGIDAASVVTSVTDQLATWYFSFKENMTDSMRSSPLTLGINFPITFFVQASIPFPAFMKRNELNSFKELFFIQGKVA